MATSSNVTYGKPKAGGAIYVGATNLTAPTDSSTALASGFTCLGYVSEDGVTFGTSMDSTEVKAWGGDTVLNIDGGKTETCTFTLMESLSDEVLKVLYGDSNVSGSLAAGLVVSSKNAALANKSWVIEMVGADNSVRRLYIPSASITDRGDVSFKDNEAIGYEITLTCVAVDGVLHKEFIKK